MGRAHLSPGPFFQFLHQFFFYMLLITGTLNGETYDSQPINPSDLITIFSIPKLKGQAIADVRLAQGRTRTDEFGQKRTLIALRLSPEFSVSDTNGNSFTLRYFKSRNRDRKTGTDNFTPVRMADIIGGAAIITAAEQDKYVWYYLSPDNQSSPFNRGNGYRYYFYDAEKEAMATLHIAAFRRSIANEIQDAHIDVIRAKALSLKIQTQSGIVSVDNAAGMGEAPLRANLLNLLDGYPREFVESWATSGDNLVGKLRLAIDRRIIIEKKDPTANNMPSWFWDTDQHKERIVVISGVKGALMALHNAFAENYNALYPILEEAMSWSNIEAGRQQIMTKVNISSSRADVMAAAWEISTEEIIGEALSREIIYYDRKDGAVYALENGEIGDELFKADPDSSSTWRAQYAEYLEDAPVQTINSLRLKLGHKVLRDRKTEPPVLIEVEDEAPRKQGRPKTKK